MNQNEYLSNIIEVYKAGIVTELLVGKIPNLTQEIIDQLVSITGLHFILEKDPEGNVCMANSKEVRPEFRQNFSVINVLDYGYAIAYSSNFRSSDKEFFQYPKNTETFWELAELGSQLKEIHSLQKIKVDNFIVEFSIMGSSIVRNPHYEIYPSKEKNYGCVYINETQYFENVPETVWNFSIENHQPAQKWLENRIGQKMNFDDVIYFQKLLFALSETERLIIKINEITL